LDVCVMHAADRKSAHSLFEKSTTGTGWSQLSLPYLPLHRHPPLPMSVLSRVLVEEWTITRSQEYIVGIPT